MTHIKIKIQTLEDANNGEKIIDARPEDVIETKEITAGILEGGMQSGKCVVAICLTDLQTGKTFIGQISESNFEGLNMAFEGSKKRFAELKKSRD